MEILIEIIKLIVKGIKEADRNSPQGRQRAEWQRQEAMEQLQRQWEQRQTVAMPVVPAPPVVPLPASTRLPAAGARRSVPLSPTLETRARKAAPRAVEPPRQTPRVQPADAEALGQWMRPTTLRSQFILTEILRPPAGLRPPVS